MSGVLSLQTMSPMELLRRRSDTQVLGATCIGGACAGCASHCLDQIPVQRIIAPLLGGDGRDFGEAWRSGADCRSGDHAGIRYRADDHVLYGVLEVDEAAFADAGNAAGDASPLQRATEDAYRRIFGLLDGEGFPHLWRVWNYLADINEQSHGLERYRQFNIGRQDAFLACGRLATGNVPAACALGVRSGPLTISFMAGRAPAQVLENPRQVSAWNYPKDYGPRSPTFARGAVAVLSEQELLFISGTASIVGHQTVHPDDVAGQARESVANISAVLGEANRVTQGRPYALGDLSYRVYVRRGEDLAAVRDALLPLLGSPTALVYVQADVCRADLLVEVEAMASQPLGTA